jgi:hypothetical protein
VFNNLFVHFERLPKLAVAEPERVWIDGNLYWQPGLDEKAAGAFFKAYRTSPLFEESKTAYASGFHARSLAADPKFVKFEDDGSAANDYRLRAASPAIESGAELPKDWPDPLRDADKGPPDIGALPLGSEPFVAGRVVRP